MKARERRKSWIGSSRISIVRFFMGEFSSFIFLDVHPSDEEREIVRKLADDMLEPNLF